MEKNNADYTKHIFFVDDSLDNKRLDLVVSKLMPKYSRSHIQNWIKIGQIQVDEKTLKQKDKVYKGQIIKITTKESSQKIIDLAQPIDLNVIYEDSEIIIINKPAGLVVHPAPGNPDKTMLNAMLYHFPELIKIPRAGIIHRLDKNTSGLIAIARTLESHTKLVRELQERNVKREYEAIVEGVMISGGTIDEKIERDYYNKKRMCISQSGKKAVTHYRIIQRFLNHTHIKVILETGRTHQIRVHMEHINYPIFSDPTYKKNRRFDKNYPKLNRQALHAKRLGFVHPKTSKYVEWRTQLPQDMQNLLKFLAEETGTQ